MRQNFVNTLLMAFLMLGPVVVTGQERGLVVHDLQVQSAAKGGSTLVRGVLENTGEQEIEIINAVSPIATAGLVVYVRDPVTDLVRQETRGVLNVAPGAQVTLVPGRLELQLNQLQEDLVAGQEQSLKLLLRDGTFRNVRLRVTTRPAEVSATQAAGEIFIQPVQASATLPRPAWLTR